MPGARPTSKATTHGASPPNRRATSGGKPTGKQTVKPISSQAVKPTSSRKVPGKRTRRTPSQQPYAQAAPNTKDHVAAGLLAIFLGSLGIHKFYLGYNTPGFIMLAVTIVGSIFSLGLAGLAMVVISIVEGVLYLSKSQTEFEQIYVFSKKEWF